MTNAQFITRYIICMYMGQLKKNIKKKLHFMIIYTRNRVHLMIDNDR